MKLASVIAGLSAAAVAFQGVAFAVRGRASLLRPPGAHGEEDFLARCIKCGKCIQACPYLALSPASADAGVAVGTPSLDARSQACRLCEDFPCVEACPTAALQLVDEKTLAQMHNSKRVAALEQEKHGDDAAPAAITMSGVQHA